MKREQPVLRISSLERRRSMAENGSKADLNWKGFAAANFPGRRRHDMRALVAYGAYKRSRAARKTPVEVVNRAENGSGTALQAWEDEGGRTP
jgi:hypothetical protein